VAESRRPRERPAPRAAADTTRLDQPRERGLRLPRLDPEAFGRLSEGIARFMGTARFLVYMTGVIIVWFAWNTLAPPGWRFDPYTFTFLTLMLSLQASYAAPLILLAQNRQADRDRLAMEEDRRRAAMQKADTEYLAREIAALRIALGDDLNEAIAEAEPPVPHRSKVERTEKGMVRRPGVGDGLSPTDPGTAANRPRPRKRPTRG
jgi:uncharacterized membrane protein